MDDMARRGWHRDALKAVRAKADEADMSTDTAEPEGALPIAAMELWTAWVSKLMSYASLQASDARSFRTLHGAADDAASLRDALSAASTGWLDPEQTEVLRSIFELWDANLDRLERLAAAVDPEWYRMWCGRSASARLRPARPLEADQPDLVSAG